MKTTALILAALGLALGALPAQTVPLFLNYQGTITDGNGKPLGSTGTAPNFTAAPTNRKIIFRIYNGPNAGDLLLWSEQQTVTIALGQFSVLLGQGTPAVYESVTEPNPPLEGVFTNSGNVSPVGPNRYLQIVVDEGNGTFTAADLPIAPRQRLTTTAYSFRAMKADTVANGAITADAIAPNSITTAKINNGAINSLKIQNGTISFEDLADDSVTSAKIADNSILNVDILSHQVDSRVITNGTIVAEDLANDAVTLFKLAPNSVNSAKIVDGTVHTAELADGAVTAAKLNASSVGFWEVNGNHVNRPTGNVGIGVGAPARKLEVNGHVGIHGNNYLELGVGENKGQFNGTISYQLHSGNALDIIGAGTDPTDRRVKIWADGGTTIVGNVGIGTDNPGVPLHVASAKQVTMIGNTYDGYNGSFSPAGSTTWKPNGYGANAWGIYWMSNHLINELNNVPPGGPWKFQAPVGIRSDGWIASAMGVVVYSDRRIKRDLKASATASDLAAIQQLKVTDYRMVDPADGGTAWRKGFIAQEVEKVIPGAVTRSNEFVPDIFARATGLDYRPIAKSLLVSLKQDHELKVGEQVRLHIDGKRHDLKVNAVPSAKSFEVADCETAPDAVFVYGRQVDDFRTVDYDRIFTTSVGALQELKKEKDAEVLALREENADLRSRLAALEADEEARNERLAAIEKLLAKEEAEVRAVSLQAGN